MSKTILLAQASGLAIAALAAGFLAGCQPNSGASAGASNVAAAPPPAATIPLADTPASGPIATAPAAQSLPAYTIRHVAPANPQDAYAFAERARYASYGYGDAPPDYGFDYGGVSPWAWQGDNGYTTVVEPVDGGDRYYYYAPGDDAPYYVRDPDYAYGYQGGVLVVVYDRYGHPLPDAEAQRWWGDGGRYFRRGQDIWRASRGSHHAVERGHWEQRRTDLDRDQAWWGQAQAENPDWRAYDSQNGPQYQNTWNQERYRREAEAYRVDQASNDGARAQREHDQALVAVGVAGAASGALAGGLLGHHEKPAPAPAVASAPPPAQAAGARPPVGEPPAPQEAKGLRPQLPPTGAPTGQQTAAGRDAMARQQDRLKTQPPAGIQPQAGGQQQSTQRAEIARQQAALHQQAAEHAQAEAAAQGRSAATAQAAAQQAAAQRASAARTQAAAQAQFKAEEARVARLQAQQAQSAAARQEQAQAQQRADAARQTQAQAQQRAEAARLTLVQSQQRAQAARQAQAQAQAQVQQHAEAARQAQVQAQQERAKADAAARAKAQASPERGGKPNPTP